MDEWDVVEEGVTMGFVTHRRQVVVPLQLCDLWLEPLVELLHLARERRNGLVRVVVVEAGALQLGLRCVDEWEGCDVGVV